MVEILERGKMLELPNERKGDFVADYEYTAKSINGRRTRGKIQAQDFDQAWTKIRAMGLYPVKVKEERGKVRRRPLGYGLLSRFMGELTVMLNSGIPLAQALNLISVKESRKDLREIYGKLYHMIVHGVDFSQAMEMQYGVFPPILIGMVRAGEAGGGLAEASEKMAEYFEREDETRKKIGTAMVYPAFLFLTVTAVVLLLFTAVLPSFFELFESMEQIPVSTQILMAVSHGLRNHFTDIAAVIISAAVILAGVFTRPGAVVWKDKMLLHIPGIGTLLRTIMAGRFARTFSFLYGGGVPFINALELTADALGSLYMKKRLCQVMEDMKNGMLLSDSLSQIREFCPELIHSIYIGEESGNLDSMLKRTAESFEIRSETAIKRLLSLLEPTMIIIMAVIIGYLMLSVMVPIYQYYQSIG